MSISEARAGGRITNLAHWVMLSQGWTRRGLGLASGALGALAMEPVAFGFILVVPMVAAVWLLDGAAERFGGPHGGEGAFGSRATYLCAFSDGWRLGFGFHLAGMFWLGNAFLVEADKFAWALPLGVVALPAALAVFTGLGFVIARALWSPGAWRILALAAGLGAAEWLRGHLFTGLPWNAFGMALASSQWTAQTASLFGLWGMTLLAIALAASPAVLADDVAMATRRRVLIASCAALACAFAFGAARLHNAVEAADPRVRIRIMQPNVPQDAKFKPQNKDAILSHYIALSDRATSPSTTGVMDATHLIWPESAFPFILGRDPQALARIGRMLPPGSQLITGAARLGDRPGEIFNAIQVIAPGGAITQSYDKTHLVPFGEYLPFDGLLRAFGLTQFVHIPGGFTPGWRREPMRIAGLPPVLPLICYEAIFPDETAEAARGAIRPGLIINVSNDGWFGRLSGPYQHFAQARLRATELGLPLARAANTGISAMIDPYGRVTKRLGLGVAGVLDASLPAALPPTLYARFGQWIVPALFALALAGALWGRLRRGEISI